MKAAVSFLEPLMDKGTSAGKGRVLLATVKGDVHDIGKNLPDDRPTRRSHRWPTDVLMRLPIACVRVRACLYKRTMGVDVLR